MAVIRPTNINQLPPTAVDVSEIIQNKISIDYKTSTNEFIKGIDVLKIYYSIPESEFYIKKGDTYKVLRWRNQNNKVNNKNYTYEYVLIPYKKRMPLKLLKGNWLKQITS
jgi:hypothetical protein